jgi:hypothetical protein
MTDTKDAPAAPAAPAPSGPALKAAYDGLETVKINLPFGRALAGVMYGPGTDVDVPKHIADTFARLDAAELGEVPPAPAKATKK